MLRKKVINALNRAESLLKKTAPLYTLSEDQKSFLLFSEMGQHTSGQSKECRATSELDENKDSLAALILDLKDLKQNVKKSRSRTIDTSIPQRIVEIGTESLVISNAYNFVAKQYHWSYKVQKGSSEREKSENKLKSMSGS